MTHSSVVSIALVLLGAVGLFKSSSGCSMPVGWRPRSNVEKILDASDVLFGRVRRTYPDSRFDYGGSSGTSAYTAEIDVHCVLKGRQTDPILNITEAGYIPGLCHATNLTVGGSYVIIVHRGDHDGRPKYSPMETQIDATQASLDELMTACGLQPVYPKGVEASSAAVQCPTPRPAGQCKSKSDFEPGNGASGNEQERVAAVHAGQAVASTATLPVSTLIAVTAVILMKFVSL